MKTRLLNLLDDFRESFWFAPAMLGILAVGLAFGVLRIDRHLGENALASDWFVHDASAAQRFLSSVSSIVITLTGVVFSITLVAISMASSQFGSRLLRCFMVDSFADRLIGLLLGTGLYCFIVLNHVVSGTNEITAFVPQFSTAIAALLGIVSVVVLIWFVHDTSLSLQAPRLIAAVAADLDDAVERLFPTPDTGEAEDSEASPKIRELPALVGSVRSHDDGYIEGIDLESLIAIAEEHDLILKLKRRPGHFVASTTTVVDIHSSKRPDDETLETLQTSIRSMILVGVRRTPRQDITCSIIELVEVAARALSPGVNNPFAAMNCIDRLAASLCRLASRRFPEAGLVDDAGKVRVITNPVTFAELVHDSFALIRQCGAGSVAVAIRLIEAFHSISLEVSKPANIRAIQQQSAAVKATFLASNPADVDVSDFEIRWAQLEQALDYSTN